MDETRQPAGAIRPFLQATTSREIVNDIVKAYPGYEMEVANGVVHVFPSALRDELNDVLYTRLGSFEVNNEWVAFASGLRRK